MSYRYVRKIVDGLEEKCFGNCFASSDLGFGCIKTYLYSEILGLLIISTYKTYLISVFPASDTSSGADSAGIQWFCDLCAL